MYERCVKHAENTPEKIKRSNECIRELRDEIEELRELKESEEE